MKTLQLILCITLCLGSFLASGQGTFNKAYDVNNGSELGAAVYIVDDGYLLFGTGSATPTDPTFITKILKVDFDGNVMWEQVYGKQGITRTLNYGAGAATSDLKKYFYLTGVFADTIEPEDVLVTKVNQVGDTIWSRTFGGPEQEVPNSIVYDTSEHLIYVTGGTRSFGPGILNAFVWVLDTAGNTINTWFWGGGDYDFGKSIVKIEDTIYLSGYTTSYGNNSEPFLMKLDTAGNVTDLNLYGTSGQDAEAGIIRNIGADQLIMWGRLDTLQDAVFVSLLDLNGKVKWRKLISWYGYIYQVRVLEDKSIMLVGINKYNRVNGNLAKLDSLGSVLWYRDFPLIIVSLELTALVIYMMFELISKMLIFYVLGIPNATQPSAIPQAKISGY